MQVKNLYNKTAQDYDQQYETPYWKLYNAITWHNLRKFLPKNKKSIILDAGGGTGYWTIKLAKLGYNVILTDVAKDMLEVARKKIKKAKLEDKITIKKTDIRNMSCFPANRFDMAISEGDPVSYCLNAKKAIKELSRVVKRNKPVVVSVDSKYSIMLNLLNRGSLDKLSSFLKTGIAKREFIFQAFTPEELTKFFRNAGLRVVRIIGKSIFSRLLDKKNRNNVIKNNFDEMLKLELKFCDKENIIGFGGHLEIVGIKGG